MKTFVFAAVAFSVAAALPLAAMLASHPQPKREPTIGIPKGETPKRFGLTPVTHK
jgi:hypothetical protein